MSAAHPLRCIAQNDTRASQRVSHAYGRMRRLAHALQDIWWDLRLGVRTLRSTPAIGGDAKPGDPTSYAVLLAVAQSVTAGDVVYDVGCGRGRACAVFARTGARVAGIEASPVAADAARRNGVTVIEGDARAADYRGATILWMFNPFGPETLRAVLRCAQAPRVLYYSGTEVHAQVFLAEGYALVRRQVVGADEHTVFHYARTATPWT
jgi:SAM-dependent methyltransferase